MAGRERRPAVVAASSQALVRLPSGEVLCVDPSSYDSTDYLLGWPVEQHVVSVFRCFLHRDAVVLDIGANFGLYSAIAAAAIGERGRLFSFEANPRTFDCLRRTLYANRAIQRPNIVAANLLVGAAVGRGTLYYLPEFLGGATTTDLSEMAPNCRSVSVAMTTIDAFIPAELSVDLVKIDVEGHEPHVLHGMTQTIARSPDIRLLVEYAEALLVHTVPGERFLAQIRELGFAVCRIQPHGLALVKPGAALTGGHELLLTRTPEQDIARVRRHSQRPAARLRRLADRITRCRHRIVEQWHRL